FRSRTFTRARMFLLSRGQVFCRAAHRPQLAFAISTPSGNARVLGTKFSVEVTEQGTTQVVTLEGTVQVGRAPTHARVGPGQSATLLETGPVVTRLTPLEIRPYLR